MPRRADSGIWTSTWVSEPGPVGHHLGPDQQLAAVISLLHRDMHLATPRRILSLSARVAASSWANGGLAGAVNGAGRLSACPGRATTSCSRLNPRARISLTALRATSRSAADAPGMRASRSVRSWLRPASTFRAIRWPVVATGAVSCGSTSSLVAPATTSSSIPELANRRSTTTSEPPRSKRTPDMRFTYVLLKKLHGPVPASSQPVHNVFGLGIARHGHSEVQVLGEPGDRADGDGKPADERPPGLERVQVSDCPAERCLNGRGHDPVLLTAGAANRRAGARSASRVPGRRSQRGWTPGARGASAAGTAELQGRASPVRTACAQPRASIQTHPAPQLPAVRRGARTKSGIRPSPAWFHHS